MEKAGLRTVKDVLPRIPGVNINVDSLGIRTISIRGIGGTGGSGNVKFMINNISVIDSMSSLFDLIMDYPVELLDRIEVIRGPGSATYGEYAYAGIVNVITRKQDSLISLGVGSFRSVSSSAALNYYSKDKQFKLNALFHHYHTDGSDSIVEADAYHSQGPEMKSLSNAPGCINERQNGKYLNVSLGYNKFSFNIQKSHLKRGNYFGPLHYLNNSSDETPFSLKQTFFEISQQIDIASFVIANLKGGLAEHKSVYEPLAIFLPGHPFFPEGFITNDYSSSKKKYSSVDIQFKLSDKHKFLLGVEYFTDKFSYLYTNIDNVELQSAKINRHVFCLTSQYEGNITDKLSFTLSLRYDKYNDIGDHISNRLAGIYHLNSNHIFKIQHANAFRPPTFTELNTFSNIESSKIETSELNYTYKDHLKTGKITLFNSTLNKVIDLSIDMFGNILYFNTGKIQSRGLECEYEQILWKIFKFNINAAYIYTKNFDTDMSMPFQSKFLANAGIIYNPFFNVHFSAHYRYVGNRSREIDDPRNNLSGYQTFNTSMMIKIPRVLTKIRLGIDNVFDEDIRDPTIIAHLFPTKATYPGDFPKPGRMMWFDIIYEF